jgi:geranylgeranyl pyrophosphate synthase
MPFAYRLKTAVLINCCAVLSPLFAAAYSPIYIDVLQRYCVGGLIFDILNMLLKGT